MAKKCKWKFRVTKSNVPEYVGTYRDPRTGKIQHFNTLQHAKKTAHGLEGLGMKHEYKFTKLCKK